MSDVRSLFQRATTHLTGGRWEEAAASFRQLLEIDPHHFDAKQLLGVALAQQDKLDEAAGVLREALRQRPGHPAVLINLGEVCRRQAHLEDAKKFLSEAVTAAPRSADAHFNLANVLKILGEDEAAAASYHQALSLKPDHVKCRFNLANTLREQGRLPAAIAEYETVRQQSPRWYDVRLNLGNAYLEAGRAADAIREYEAAQAIDPSSLEIADSLGDAHSREGRVDEARDQYRKALPRHSHRWLRELRIDTLLDVIPFNVEEVARNRELILNRVRALAKEPLSLDVATLHLSGAEPPMGLAYHGQDERPIRDAYGDLFTKWIPSQERKRPEGKPHIGIVVTSGHEGVFGRCLAPLIERLDSEKLRVTLVCSLSGKNILSHLFFKRPQEYLVLPPRIDEAAGLLAHARFHVLHYWEVGTDSTNYFLPFFQPAAVQSTTWGWPVTSGNPRIDSFVSAVGLEPPHYQQHYREGVVLLNSAPTYYETPPVPGTSSSKTELGFPNVPIYFCPQNLRKFHPDFDSALTEILRRDPNGLLLCIEDEQPMITARFAQRLRTSLGDAASRMRILPRMDREKYLAVLSAADVNLDTFHYGGGANTVYDSVAAGTPLVTWPGEFHRGRYAMATLQSLEIEETIATSRADFVTRAILVANEADLRRDIAERMKARRDRVLENPAAVKAYEEFFLSAANKAH